MAEHDQDPQVPELDDLQGDEDALQQFLEKLKTTQKENAALRKANDEFQRHVGRLQQRAEETGDLDVASDSVAAIEAFEAARYQQGRPWDEAAAQFVRTKLERQARRSQAQAAKGAE